MRRSSNEEAKKEKFTGKIKIRNRRVVGEKRKEGGRTDASRINQTKPLEYGAVVVLKKQSAAEGEKKTKKKGGGKEVGNPP